MSPDAHDRRDADPIGLGALARARMWGPLGVIDARVARPGDTETRRFQKMLVVVVASVGSVATVFNAMQLFRGDLEPMGWTYIASAIYLALGAIAILIWPQLYVPVTFLLLLDVLIFPTIVQVLSGGLTSGLYAMPWTLFAPLGAALALGVVAAGVHLGLFVITVMAVAILQPSVPDWAPVISDEVLMSINVPSLLSLGLMAGASSLYLLHEVERFRTQADGLLLDMLPTTIAARLKAGEQRIADGFDGITVLFADIAGFTQLSSDADPGEIVHVLDELFSDLDDLADAHRIEKIKTIGDAYMAAAGIPDPRHDHVDAMLDFAVALLDAVDGRPGLGGGPTHLRIGIHTGPAVAGVIGRERFIYDLWGDTVNLASRMQVNGVVDRIQVTEEVVAAASDRFSFERREPILIKGKGMMVTYLLVT